MHIGLDGLPLTSAKTGVGHYTSELGRALAEANPSDKFQFLYPSTYPTIDEDGCLPENLGIQRVNVGPLNRHWWSVGLPRFIRRNKLQLFHGTNYEVPLWRPCPTVLTIHDLSLLLYAETHTARSARRARRRLPIMVRAAGAIITPTAAVRREVCDRLSAPAAKVFVVPEAARTSFCPVELSATTQVREKLGVRNEFVLAVGTIEPRKNLISLIEAFAEVLLSQPQKDLQLVIAGGRGWLAAPILSAIEKSPARNNILLTNYLHDYELRALYSSCRAFVYPSLYEGFGLPPLEAMACGAPVIASDIAALRETLGQAALFVPARNVSRLARTLVEIVDDENARRVWSAKGLARAAEFSWQRTAELTLDVYKHVLQKKDSKT